MDIYEIKNVDYHTQRNNRLDPFRTCYPTSIATIIDYCLSLIGKSKVDIGCTTTMQLDDCITQIAGSREMKKWIRDNVSWIGNWILNVNPRYAAVVETYIFNSLMNQFGYYSRFKTNVCFEDYCDSIEETRLPQIAFGRFPGILVGTGGHICTAVGFNKNDMTLTVMDPYGNALTRYRDSGGAYVAYPIDPWFTRNTKNQTLWIQEIRKA